MKKFEHSEVTTGNASGKVGVSSLPFGRGFYQSKNNNDFGVSFTPDGEQEFKTYKSMKHSKRKLKKMKKFEEFIKEDACATLGNTGGMGAVVSAQPSSTPGAVNAPDSTPGSGDIGHTLGTYMKSAPNLKKNKKAKKMKNLKSFGNFTP